MASVSMAKVVRVEDVEPKTPYCANESLGTEMMTVSVIEDEQKRKSIISVESQVSSDKMYPLPENWPKILQLARPRSCELTNIWTPCLRKAVSHIELLQNAIQQSFESLNEKQLLQKNLQQTSEYAGGKRQLKFPGAVDEKAMISNEDQFSYRQSSTRMLSSRGLSSVKNDLSVFGVGAYVEEGLGSEKNDIPYLGAQEVIDEVIILLARLENDWHETQEAYLKEVARTEMLRAKIDELRLRRLKELPALVQREHETCIMDLSELQWHLAYTTHNEEKAQQRYKTAEKINSHLKEDIAFVKQHVPLVQEKLILEVEAMDKIRKAQGDTDQELVMTNQRLAKTQMKSTEAITKAETERGYIKKELDRVREDLASISEELNEAKMTFNAYIHQVNDVSQQLIDNEQEMKVLQVKNENAKVAEEMQATKVRNLQSKLTQAGFEYRRLENENDQLEQELNTTKNRNNHRLQDLENQVTALEVKHKTIFHKNQEITMDIEDCEEKIARCNQQKISDEKNVARINREMEKTGDMLHKTMESYKGIAALNHHLHGQRAVELDKTFQVEQKLKITVETLRKHVKDEMHTRTVLNARISSDGNEIEKTKVESAKKNEKIQSIADEVERAVSAVLEKVEKLRSAKAERQQLKNNLTTKLKDTETMHKESQEKLTKTIEKLEPQHHTVKNELKNLNDQLHEMERSTQMMKSKIEEMDAAQQMMERSVKTSEETIAVLTSEREELNLQITSGRKLNADLLKQYNDMQERSKESENKHKALMKDREAVLKKYEADKTRYKEINKDLASRYRQLQNYYLLTKEQMLKSYEERIQLEAAITDVKQLSSIQSKLQGALAEYFKLSGLYNEAELCKLEKESSHNADRVSELQVSMEQALEQISQFLSSQMDVQMVKQIALDTVMKRSEQVVLPNISQVKSGLSTLSSVVNSRQPTAVV
ncbi:unnamed protein product [Lymnaea stagnalis]|uniref:Uncharacterized protein n=1 Tax=Lymnaea stagnalis TaxID=6523 RepID=A0AAV2H0S2_LYMST